MVPKAWSGSTLPSAIVAARAASAAASRRAGSSQCSGSILRFHSIHLRRELSVVSSGSTSMPIWRAKRCAPSPTSRWWSVSRSTASATAAGVRTPSSAATPPARLRLPSMQAESSCTTPSAFGRPPKPTLSSVGSRSARCTPATAACTGSSPARSCANASSTAVRGPLVAGRGRSPRRPPPDPASAPRPPGPRRRAAGRQPGPPCPPAARVD